MCVQEYGEIILGDAWYSRYMINDNTVCFSFLKWSTKWNMKDQPNYFGFYSDWIKLNGIILT